MKARLAVGESNMIVRPYRPACAAPHPCRDLAAAAAAVHGGYISPFGRHFWNISCSLQATLLLLLSHFLGLLLVCQLLWAARGALDVVTTCAHACEVLAGLHGINHFPVCDCCLAVQGLGSTNVSIRWCFSAYCTLNC